MQLLTLTNSFHHTEARVRAFQNMDGAYYLSPSQAKRARKKLCGIAECTCGDAVGARDATFLATQIDDQGSICLESK